MDDAKPFAIRFFAEYVGGASRGTRQQAGRISRFQDGLHDDQRCVAPLNDLHLPLFYNKVVAEMLSNSNESLMDCLLYTSRCV